MAHDAKYWAAWAATASAIAAIASTAAGFLSVRVARRAAFAAEESARLAIRPNLLFSLVADRKSESDPISIVVRNQGPGVCFQFGLS